MRSHSSLRLTTEVPTKPVHTNDDPQAKPVKPRVCAVESEERAAVIWSMESL
jgi:hypothetical protein